MLSRRFRSVTAVVSSLSIPSNCFVSRLLSQLDAFYSLVLDQHPCGLANMDAPFTSAQETGSTTFGFRRRRQMLGNLDGKDVGTALICEVEAGRTDGLRPRCC